MGHQDEHIRQKFLKLYKVLSFWLIVYELDKEEKIDRELAIKLFKYQYEWWHRKLEKLIRETPEDERPEVFSAFLGDGIIWLQREQDNNLIQFNRFLQRRPIKTLCTKKTNLVYQQKWF